MAGIYIHIPFCRHACTYCDFHFSTVLRGKRIMAQAIAKELEIKADFLPQKENLDSLYFGGGTPSVLDETELRWVFEAVHRQFSFREGAEITLEANPEDITDEQVAIWKGLGINRLSIGVQSFFADDLEWMNRQHSPDQARQAVEIARKAGIDLISVDLIFGLPYSTPERWAANVNQALGLGVQHLSFYSLTVEEKTALAHQVKKGKIELPKEESYSEQYLFAHHRLQDAGFEHYEVSNYALPGFRAVHNSSYWEGQPYLGIGPSAHGYDGKVRYWNHAHNVRYLDDVNAGKYPEADREMLSPEDLYHDYLLTHLRHIKGIDVAHIEQKWVPDWREHFGEKVHELKGQHMLIQDGDTLRMTPEGWMVSDHVIGEFFL